MRVRVAGLAFSVTRSEAWTAVAMSTATRYTDIPLSTSTAMLTYTSVFNSPLRSPVTTHVLPSTAFHFYIYSYCFRRFTLFRPCNSPSLHHLFLWLGSQYECYIHWLQPKHYSKIHKLLQGFRISWLTWQIDMSRRSFFISRYTKTKIIISTEGLIEQYPDNQILHSSHSSVTVQARFVIFLFSKQFSFLRFLSCTQYLDFYFFLQHPHKPFQQISSSIKALTTHSAYSPLYGT